ncbi:MAG: dihydropteroate synthase-like protein [Promethearchaeota archaeon]
MIIINILIITGQNSYGIIENIVHPYENHDIDIKIAPVSVSAFITEQMVRKILSSCNTDKYNLILLPGFVQWDTQNLENRYGINIRKGPEFASDLPLILNDPDHANLSNTLPANRLLSIIGENEYNTILNENLTKAKEDLGRNTFYINKEKSDLIIGKDLPPAIIAEIVNCTEKSDKKVLKKVKHYIESGADIIDLGCVANKPNPYRVRELIEIIQENYEVLLSIDSMDYKEITFAVDANIDMILSLDLGNYNDFINLPKDIPIVILPTKIKEGYFPKEPETRIDNLFNLTQELIDKGFKKLIADPLLESPIVPGIARSLETYFLYKKRSQEEEYNHLELPLFFGISNVIELMDIDSVGINGLLASIAIELDMGILFTVEHSTKLMRGVQELKECVKLNYLAKHKKTPPINQGIQVFKAKGKTSQDLPRINEEDAVIIKGIDENYDPDDKGYFKIYVNHYDFKIYVLFFNTDHKLVRTILGSNAESIGKKIIELNLTTNPYHLIYLGRELNKAEVCLLYGKPYIQDK